MTPGEGLTISRLSLAAYSCICIALSLVVLLGVWGAYRDVHMARETALRNEVTTIRSHAVRTVGRIEWGLEQQSEPADLASVRHDPWIRQFWRRVIPVERGRLYAAIADSTGTVLMHSDPTLEGRRISRDWYRQKRPEVAGNVFETESTALAGSRRAFDVQVPIEVEGKTIGTYHAGIDVDWFQDQFAVQWRQIVHRWLIVVGGISAVVLLAGVSLYYVAYRSAQMRNLADVLRLQRVSELSQLAAGLAHEIRNPLHAIRLNLHALGRMQNGRPQLNAEEIATIVNESNEEILRLDRLVEELLGFAKPDEAHEELIDLASELQATLSFVDREMQSSGVEVCARIADASVYVHMDPTRLRQIMLNLLMNAREAAGEDGRIEVGLVRRHDRVEIRVVDDGPGIAQADRQRIFDPFYTTKENGSGLGLALVKRFVEEANGRIDCESNGTGTTFCVSLPTVVRAG